jgi:hypothetical protein
MPPRSTENLVGTCLHAARIPSDIHNRARGRLYCRHSEVTRLHSSSQNLIVCINLLLIFIWYFFCRSSKEVSGKQVTHNKPILCIRCEPLTRSALLDSYFSNLKSQYRPQFPQHCRPFSRHISPHYKVCSDLRILWDWSLVHCFSTACYNAVSSNSSAQYGYWDILFPSTYELVEKTTFNEVNVPFAFSFRLL